MTSRRPLFKIALSALALVALLATSANADLARQKRADAHASAFRAAKVNIPVRDPAPPPGAQVLKYKFGPMRIQPGQNLINIDLQKERPDVDGYVVGFRPGLVYASNGKSPSVKIVHLHHAVWLVGDDLLHLKPTFAAGEEKTNFNAPTGFGWRYTTKQTWVLNHMIHDLTASPQNVYLTYTLYFIPDTAPEAANITPIDTQWMDVQGVKPYPVFNALKGKGTKTRSGTTEFTYPEQAPNAYKADGIVRNKWVVDHDATLVSTAGHLHPGGLWTDLTLTRDGVTKRIFRSRANYFEPAGNVSWDVAMSATTDAWKVNVKKGDILSVSATYDTSKSSWYEVMGIMVVGITKNPVPGGVDPFDPSTGTLDQTDYLTHGRLKENIDSGVRKPNVGLRNPSRLRTGPFKDRIIIKNFLYNQGDLSLPGKSGLPPAVRQGHSLTFVNEDAPLTERFHTITACRAPCNLTGGIGYPLANGARFDSGELGYGPTISTLLYGAGQAAETVPITAVLDVPTDSANCKDVPGLVGVIKNGCVGTTVYKTPKNLKPGTYAYFCRIHPFMRGAFRVVKKNAKA
jgi:hypothetical protein